MRFLDTPLRYWRTVRYLKPVQIYARVWHRWYRPGISMAGADPFRLPVGRWHPVPRTPRQLGPRHFRFLGVERHLSTAADWNHPAWPKLWLYNLHYFEDLVATDAAQRVAWHRDLIARWIAENPVGVGNGWEPYPTSLRLVNWGKWLLAGNTPSEEMRQSMALQARHLEGRLEYHLLGNHLWANLKALLFCGCLFDGQEADRWQAAGLRAFRTQLTEQILPDGGHFERSPMYHALLFEDLLDLLQLTERFPERLPASDIASWRETARRMGAWLRTMCHPDGEIAFFNDAAFDIAARPADLDAYAARVGVARSTDRFPDSQHLTDSGYLRLVRGSAVILADAAPVGPDHLPGHAHADTLSFELSLDGSRVFVNGGTSTYEPCMQRRIERATASHNTVTVDGQDSSEVWGAFRVARRAFPRDVWMREEGEWITAQASHNGYRRLPGKVIHHRRWALHSDGLKVDDLLTGSFTTAVSRFRLTPGWKVMIDDSQSGRLKSTLRTIRFRCLQGSIITENAEWHPEFGHTISAEVIAVQCDSGGSSMAFWWSDTTPTSMQSSIQS